MNVTKIKINGKIKIHDLPETAILVGRKVRKKKKKPTFRNWDDIRIIKRE